MDVNLQGTFINNVWTVSLGIQKYQNNPTSTSLDTKHYSIHNVDFPGITICPNTKVRAENPLNRCNYAFFSDNEEQLPSGYANQELALEESDPEDGG